MASFYYANYVNNAGVAVASRYDWDVHGSMGQVYCRY